MNLNKTIINYIMLTGGAFLFDRIYTLFGHGVTSLWMSNLYLYFLGPGVLVFLFFKIFIPGIVSCKNYRLFFNTYNSGIAVLVTGMLLYGIIEIAGGTSQIVSWFLYIGSGLVSISVFIFCKICRVKFKSLHR